MRKKLTSILMSMILCLSAIAFSACNDTPIVPTEDDIVTIVSFKEITSMPDKVAYKEKEIFDITGLVASVNLSNGKTRKYYATEFKTYTHKDEPLTTAVTKITVTVPETEITFDVPITVSEVPLAVLSVKEIKTNPKKSYVEYEVFDISDLVVTVNMTDDTEKDITGAEFTEWTHKDEPLEKGVEYIRALIPGAQDPTLFVEIPITVGTRYVHVTNAAIKTNPAVVNYFTNEKFDISGIEVEVTLDYPAGAKKTLTAADFPASSYTQEPLAKGTSKVTVTVPHPNTTGDEKTVEVPITVDDYGDLTVKSFSRIVSNPTVTSYRAGDSFLPAGLEVEVTLSNNRIYTIKYADEPSAFVIPSKALAAIDEAIEITFAKSNGVKFNVPITVSESLQVDTGRLNDYYLGDEVIDFTRVLAVRWIEGGSATVVSPDDYELFDGQTKITDKTSAVLATAGTHTLTVKYNNAEASFEVVIRDKSSVIYPSVIEAEDNVFYNDDYTIETKGVTHTHLKDDPYTTSENAAVAEYFDAEQDKPVTGPRLPSGASGKGAVSSLSNWYNNDDTTGKRNSELVYFKFTVNVPASGTYKLKMRAASTGDQTVNKDTFNININGTDDDLVYSPLSLVGNRTVKGGNQIAKYMDLGTKADGSAVAFTSWYGMFWWSVVDLGDYELIQGENTIRFKMVKNTGINIDYFEVSAGDVSASTQLFSMREAVGSERTRVDLGRNAIYLKKGERITDAVKASATSNTNALYDKIPYKFTLIYLRTVDGASIPVGEHMLSGLDYDLVGVEQTVTVTVKEKGDDAPVIATATFKVFIENEETV